MNLIDVAEPQHIDDGDLIRLHDGECSTDEELALRDHLGACRRCDQRFETLSRLARGFVEAVKTLDEPENRAQGSHGRSVARPFWRRHGLKVAASIIVLIGATVVVPPARAWIVNRWDALVSLVTQRDRSGADGTAPAPELSQRATSTVSFEPGGTHFAVEVANPQATGRLTFTIEPGTTASARVINGDGSEEWVVLPSGVRLQNQPTSAASYEITLPTYLMTAEVRVAGALVGSYQLDIVARPRFEVLLDPQR